MTKGKMTTSLTKMKMTIWKSRVVDSQIVPCASISSCLGYLTSRREKFSSLRLFYAVVFPTF